MAETALVEDKQKEERGDGRGVGPLARLALGRAGVADLAGVDGHDLALLGALDALVEDASISVGDALDGALGGGDGRGRRGLADGGLLADGTAIKVVLGEKLGELLKVVAHDLVALVWRG